MNSPQPPHGNPADPPADRPPWGQPPTGGWGAQPAPDDRQQAWDPDQTSVADPRDPWAQPGEQGYGGRQYGQQPPQYGQAPYGQQQPPPYESTPSYGQQPTQQWSGDQQSWGPQPTQQWPQPGGQPPGGQHPGGQWDPGYRQPDATARPASRGMKLPLIAGGVAVLVIAVVAVLGFVTPAFFVTKVFDAAALESGVTKVLTESYGLKGVTGVTCKSDIRVTNGAAFDCDAVIDGKTKKVPIKVTSSDGTYEVSQPL